MWCDACRSIGQIHCAHPDECGNMRSKSAAAENWNAWLDDLPVGAEFQPAIERLQDFIAGIAMPAPDPVAIREAWEKAYWRMRSYAVHDNDCKLNKPPRFDGPCSCGLTAALEEALALIPKGAAEPTEYERKVAQMKKDFPNGI